MDTLSYVIGSKLVVYGAEHKYMLLTKYQFLIHIKIMIKYPQKNIKILKSLSMLKNSLKAIKDYSHLKSDLKWKN